MMSNFDFDIPLPKHGKIKDYEDVENFPLKASKFFAPDEGKTVQAKRAVILNRCNSKNKGAKFASRMVTENGIEGIRIWRVL
jgi:hypothetical protein